MAAVPSAHCGWGGTLQANMSPASPPFPQTMQGNLVGAVPAEAPGSPFYVQSRMKSSSFHSPRASPKTPKASRKAYMTEDPPEEDPCGPTLNTFAGRYGFTVTTSNTCTSYSNARCSHEIILENRAAAPKGPDTSADAEEAPARDDSVHSMSPAEPPAALTTTEAGNMLQPGVLPWPAALITTVADNSMMLPPMPHLPLTSLQSQASLQQPATPAAVAALQRAAAAASQQGSPAFFRTVSTGLPVLVQSNSNAHELQALAVAPAASSAEESQHVVSAAPLPAYFTSPPSTLPQAWKGNMAAPEDSNPCTDPAHHINSCMQRQPGPAGAHQHQQCHPQHSCMGSQQMQAAGTAGGMLVSNLRAQIAAAFGVGPMNDSAPPSAVTQAPAPTAAYMMPPDWYPVQSMGLDCLVGAAQQCLTTQQHDPQQRLQQQANSTPSRPTSSQPGSPSKSKKDSSPSRSRREGSPSRNNSSANRQQSGASTAYQQVLRRSLRHLKSRGPKYDPTAKTAAAAAARFNSTGASLLGKHRLSNCSSLELGWAGSEGTPQQGIGNLSTGPIELDGCADEALVSGFWEQASNMRFAASLGGEGFEGFVLPVDSVFADEDCTQQQVMYACTPASPTAAAAAVATEGIAPVSGRASSMDSDWFRELGVQDIAGSQRCSLFSNCMPQPEGSTIAPMAAAQPLLSALAGSCISYYRCSDTEVENEVQRTLAYRPVWGVQACVGQVGKQSLIDGGENPDKFYAGVNQGSRVMDS